MSHNSDAALDEWYRNEHVLEISKCPGYRRMARYTNASRSLLSAFSRTHPRAPTWLAVHEFEGPEIPWTELAATDETEWAKRVVPGIRDIDFGVFKLVQIFEKKEQAKL